MFQLSGSTFMLFIPTLCQVQRSDLFHAKQTMSQTWIKTTNQTNVPVAKPRFAQVTWKKMKPHHPWKKWFIRFYSISKGNTKNARETYSGFGKFIIPVKKKIIKSNNVNQNHQPTDLPVANMFLDLLKTPGKKSQIIRVNDGLSIVKNQNSP